MEKEINKQVQIMGKTEMQRILPVSLDTSVQILKKQLPCDQNLHRNPACKCKAFSKHIFSFHKVTTPVEKVKSFNTSRSLVSVWPMLACKDKKNQNKTDL